MLPPPPPPPAQRGGPGTPSGPSVAASSAAAETLRGRRPALRAPGRASAPQLNPEQRSRPSKTPPSPCAPAPPGPTGPASSGAGVLSLRPRGDVKRLPPPGRHADRRVVLGASAARLRSAGPAGGGRGVPGPRRGPGAAAGAEVGDRRRQSFVSEGLEALVGFEEMGLWVYAPERWTYTLRRWLRALCWAGTDSWGWGTGWRRPPPAPSSAEGGAGRSRAPVAAEHPARTWPSSRRVKPRAHGDHPPPLLLCRSGCCPLAPQVESCPGPSVSGSRKGERVMEHLPGPGVMGRGARGPPLTGGNGRGAGSEPLGQSASLMFASWGLGVGGRGEDGKNGAWD